MAGTVEQITTARRVEIEEDARHDNDLLLETGLEEVEAVGDGLGETLEVEPPVTLVGCMVCDGRVLTGRRWNRGHI